MGKALIISSDADLMESINALLKPVGHNVIKAVSIQKGWTAAAKERVDAVLLNTGLSDGDGLALLPRLKQLPQSPEVIVVTRKGDPKSAEFALRNGAWDYLVVNADPGAVASSLDQALQYRDEQSIAAPAVAIKRERIIGNSPKMKACLALLGQTAGSDVTVLITGETGTGKELFARAIHSNSPRFRPLGLGAPRPVANPRADKNFVVVDCTALPETLVESVLFGHVRGAFTGAERDQEGLIAQADGGTLFLDEVGEMSLNIQKAFLRVLQERQFRPVGDKSERTSNFRLVAATNRNLDEMVAQGTFRKDLLFRLRALTIELPPLRERREDIRDMIRHHTTRLCETYNLTPKRFSDELLDAMTQYSWPGNVREMINTLDGMLAVAGNDAILYPKHLPLNLRVQVMRSRLDEEDGSANLEKVTVIVGKLPSYKAFREETETRYLRDLMALAEGSITKACRISGISRSRLYEMLAKSALNTPTIATTV